MRLPRTWVTFAKGFKKEKADRHGDDVGNDDDPDKGKGQIEFALGRRNEHVGSGHDALDDKGTE